MVADHLVLHPQLEGGNFIIKAIWLPGSQTELALVTADFIKIYDLSKDAISPKYFFLVPAGKVRDCTFFCNESVNIFFKYSKKKFLKKMHIIKLKKKKIFLVRLQLHISNVFGWSHLYSRNV